MVKRNGTKGQTMIYKTLYRKLKIEEHEPHKKRGEPMGSGRVKTVPSPIVKPVVLPLLQKVNFHFSCPIY
jgi:hypothetical protein